MEWRRGVLTDDAVKYFPVRGIKNPVWLTGGEDKRSCKPIMVEHLQWVGLKKENNLMQNLNKVVSPLPQDRQRSS